MERRMSWLREDERQLIVDSAVGLLERKGFRFNNSVVLPTLRKAGAAVDSVTGTARLPRALVEEALNRAPGVVCLGGSSSEDDCVLDGTLHFLNSGTATHTLDYRSGEYRPSTAADLRDATIVFEALSFVDVLWPIVTANDCRPQDRLLNDWVTVLKHSRRHVQHELEGPEQVGALRQIIEILVSDEAEFRRRPRMSVICCPSAPLQVDPRILDGCLELAKLGTPVCILPMPIAGATSPVSLAGTMLVNVAEFLAVATAFEFYAPGVPLIMGIGTSLLDMRRGTFAFGAVEAAQMCAACCELGHDLGVPVLAPGMATDAKHAGVQASAEKMLKGMAVASAGADLVTGGIGLLNGANLLSLPQIVIDTELARMIQTCLTEIAVSEEAMMLDVIEDTPFGGSFLGARQTRSWLASNPFLMPLIADRGSYEQWRERSLDESDIAALTVDEILSAPGALEPILPKSVTEQLDRISRAPS